MEGTSSAAGMDGTCMYHIGGFGGKDAPTVNNIRAVTLDFPTGVFAKITASTHPEVHLLVDALKVLNGPTNIKIADNPMVMGISADASGAVSSAIADNYKNMFRVDHVHND